MTVTKVASGVVFTKVTNDEVGFPNDTISAEAFTTGNSFISNTSQFDRME